MTVARGGVVYGLDADGEELVFLPVDVVREVTSLTHETRVPGALPPVTGVALAKGEVVTVLRLGAAEGAPAARWRPGEDWPVPGGDRALLCEVRGERLAVTGGRVVATGLFDVVDEDDPRPAVRYRDRVVRELNVGALYAQVEAAIWAAHVGAESAVPSSEVP